MITASNYTWVKRFGWCDRSTTLSFLKLADAACWPWLHTTLIEDSVAVGTPLIVKMSDNVSHFAKENAGVFLNEGNSVELAAALSSVMNTPEVYKDNVIIARDKYSYSTLVKCLDTETFCE